MVIKEGRKTSCWLDPSCKGSPYLVTEQVGFYFKVLCQTLQGEWPVSVGKGQRWAEHTGPKQPPYTPTKGTGAGWLQASLKSGTACSGGVLQSLMLESGQESLPPRVFLLPFNLEFPQRCWCLSSSPPLTASHWCKTIQGEFPAQTFVILSEPSLSTKSHMPLSGGFFCFVFYFS